MGIAAPKKSAMKSLAYQTKLLKRIATTQDHLLQKHQVVGSQITWLKLIGDRANKQLGYLKNTSTVATLIGLLTTLSMCGWLWATFIGI